MLLLTSTSDKIQAVTDSTANVDFHASWGDNNNGAITPGRTNSASSSVQTLDIVAAPAASIQRNIKTLSIRNRHASTACTVTIRHTDGTTTVDLFKVSLLAGEKVEYSTENGWVYYSATGIVKTANSNETCVALSADQSNSTVTPTEVTGLTIALSPGVYTASYFILYQAAATTTGVRFSVNFSGTVTAFVANQTWVDASATAATAAADQDAVLATGSVVGAMAARAKSTAGWGTTISVDTANADMLMRIDVLFVVTVAGNLQLYHGSEVAAASTVKAGTVVTVKKCG